MEAVHGHVMQLIAVPRIDYLTEFGHFMIFLPFLVYIYLDFWFLSVLLMCCLPAGLHLVAVPQQHAELTSMTIHTHGMTIQYVW